jgi:hypothetical protein
VEDAGLSGRQMQQCPDWTFRRLRDRCRFQRRGPIPVKGKGDILTYFLVGRADSARD